MAYHKSKGMLQVKCVGVVDGYPDLRQAQTGGKVPMKFLFTPSEALLERFIHAQAHGYVMHIMCSKDREGNFHFKSYSPKNMLISHGIKKRHEKRIAFDGMMREVEKTQNPARGSSRQKLSTGRQAMKITSRTSGKIGAALQASINMMTPERERFLALTKMKRQRRAEIASIRQRQATLERNYDNWLLDHKKEDSDKNWLRFLRDYEDRGRTQELIAQGLDKDKENYARLLQEEADFLKFTKEFSV